MYDIAVIGNTHGNYPPPSTINAKCLILCGGMHDPQSYTYEPAMQSLVDWLAAIPNLEHVVIYNTEYMDSVIYDLWSMSAAAHIRACIPNTLKVYMLCDSDVDILFNGEHWCITRMRPYADIGGICDRNKRYKHRIIMLGALKPLLSNKTNSRLLWRDSKKLSKYTCITAANRMLMWVNASLFFYNQPNGCDVNTIRYNYNSHPPLGVSETRKRMGLISRRRFKAICADAQFGVRHVNLR